MIKLTALKYYLSSFFTLLNETNFFSIPLVFIRRPVLIYLKCGLHFYADTLMDIWAIKEVVLDKQYDFHSERETGKELNVVIDIGAGIGDYAVLQSFHSKRVYSFDIQENRIKLAQKTWR